MNVHSIFNRFLQLFDGESLEIKTILLDILRNTFSHVLQVTNNVDGRNVQMLTTYGDILSQYPG